MQVKVHITRFPFMGIEHPDVGDWLVDTVVKCKRDPRISAVSSKRYDDTPITMTRNRAAKEALDMGVDYLLMVDSDMNPDEMLKLGDPAAKPFWDSSFDYVMAQRDQGGVPCTVASPYCGPPPNSNVYVFCWESWQNPDQNPQPDHRLEQFSRHEAAQRSGIEEVGALPTGLILIDMRVFRKLKPPWFYYEWSDEYQQQKASTEDVTFTRDISLLGYPVYCNWDSWSGHHKRICVRKPAIIHADHVKGKLAEAVLNGHRSDERQLAIKKTLPAILGR